MYYYLKYSLDCGKLQYAEIMPEHDAITEIKLQYDNVYYAGPFSTCKSALNYENILLNDEVFASNYRPMCTLKTVY